MNKAHLTKEERAAMADRFFGWLHRVLTTPPPPETGAYDTILREAKITSPLGWSNFLRFLAATMIEYSGHGTDMMASIRTIASDAHIGKSTAQRYLDAAVKLHMLEQTRPPGKRTCAAYAIADWDWDGDHPRSARAEDEPEQARLEPEQPPGGFEDPQVTSGGYPDRVEDRFRGGPVPPLAPASGGRAAIAAGSAPAAAGRVPLPVPRRGLSTSGWPGDGTLRDGDAQVANWATPSPG